MQWVKINIFIGIRGETLVESLFAQTTTFTNDEVLGNATQILPCIVADGLLVRDPAITLTSSDIYQIWRCFKIWNNSLRIIALSLLLFVAEIGNIPCICSLSNTYIFSGIYLTVVVFDLVPRAHITPATHNTLMGAGLFTTLAMTLWTTILIAYRIYSASRHILNGAKPHFYNILEIVLQSSFLYSLALAASALLAAMPSNQSNIWTIFTALNYSAAILTAVTVCQTRYIVLYWL